MSLCTSKLFSLICAVAGLIVCATANAATFNVSAGNVSELRQAIAAANANGEADIINVQGRYRSYPVTSSYDKFGPNAYPPITSEIRINGNGGSLVQAVWGTGRLFYVASGGKLTLVNLKLQNAVARGGEGGSGGGGGGVGLGGAIFNHGEVVLEGCTFNDNWAIGGDGGDGSIYGGGGGGSPGGAGGDNKSIKSRFRR